MESFLSWIKQCFFIYCSLQHTRVHMCISCAHFNDTTRDSINTQFSCLCFFPLTVHEVLLSSGICTHWNPKLSSNIFKWIHEDLLAPFSLCLNSVLLVIFVTYDCGSQTRLRASCRHRLYLIHPGLSIIFCCSSLFFSRVPVIISISLLGLPYPKYQTEPGAGGSCL
jgi:hypothetical protein